MEEMRGEFKRKRGGGGGVPGDMFTGPEAEAKLKADPSTAPFFSDPQFMNLWTQLRQMGSTNPQMMMQLF